MESDPYEDGPDDGNPTGDEPDGGKPSEDGKPEEESDRKKPSGKDSDGEKYLSEKKLPPQGVVDGGVENAPLVDAGKQGKHVYDHANELDPSRATH